MRLKSVRLKPLKLPTLRWSKTGSLRSLPWAAEVNNARFKVFGGLAFASLLLVQVSSPLGRNA
ncbi:MAG: hypothetical protein AAFW95_09420, partial [Cyanobacteria bacterium J06638_6]